MLKHINRDRIGFAQNSEKHLKWNAFGWCASFRALNCVVFVHRPMLAAHSDTKRSIYNIQITIIHIIAFTITINYPNIVKILWMFSTNELVNFIDIGCWRSSLLQTHESKHIVASHTGMLWNNRQFTIRVVVYIMRRHIVVHVHIWMGRVGFLFFVVVVVFRLFTNGS